MLVDICQLLHLLVCLPGDQLQFLWPDVSRPREVEDLLPGGVDDHGGHLVASESLVLEARVLFYHFVEDLVAFLGDAQSRLFIFGDRFVVLALEEDTICQEDLDEVDREDESKIPLEKLHQHSLCFDDIRVARTLRGILRQPLVVSLDVIDEDQVVVDLVVLGGYQETGCQQDCHSSRS